MGLISGRIARKRIEKLARIVLRSAQRFHWLDSRIHQFDELSFEPFQSEDAVSSAEAPEVGANRPQI
ncbi:hypothetical protein GCM10027421_28530 [Microbacterium shaanxiense]